MSDMPHASAASVIALAGAVRARNHESWRTTPAMRFVIRDRLLQLLSTISRVPLSKSPLRGFAGE